MPSGVSNIVKSCGKAHSYCKICAPNRVVRNQFSVPEDYNIFGICEECGVQTCRQRIKLCKSCAMSKPRKPLTPEHKLNIASGVSDWYSLSENEKEEYYLQEEIKIEQAKINTENRLQKWTDETSEKHKNKYTWTKIHQKLFEFLTLAGYFVINEKNFLRYSIDCFVPELNIGFEADGDYWHGRADTMVNDKIRDQQLLEIGIIIVRFSETEINNWSL